MLKQSFDLNPIHKLMDDKVFHITRISPYIQLNYSLSHMLFVMFKNRVNDATKEEYKNNQNKISHNTTHQTSKKDPHP